MRSEPNSHGSFPLRLRILARKSPQTNWAFRGRCFVYLKAMGTPGGEVIKKTCDEWHLSLSIKGFQFTGEAFASEVNTEDDARAHTPAFSICSINWRKTRSSGCVLSGYAGPSTEILVAGLE